MGFLSKVFGGEKQKASKNEKFLADVGKAQIGASKMFEAAHQAMLREANADQSGIIRGRAAGSTWQGLAGDLGTNRLTGGDARRQGKFEGMAELGLGTALRGGTNSAQKLKDETVMAGATSRLSNAQRSGATARDEARDVAREAAQKVELANQWNQDLAGAAVTAGVAGGLAYQRHAAANAAPKAVTPTASYSPHVNPAQRTLATLGGGPAPTAAYSPIARPGTNDLLMGYR